MGINFEFPLFQGLSVRADIAEAQGGIRIANSHFNVLRQKIIQEVQEKYFSVKYAEEKYKATEKIIVQSEKNLKLAEGRFETGVGSAIEITDANVSLTNSRIDRLSALYEYKMALLRFDKAIGRLKP
jgi:outer membrane protein TolC